MVIIQFQVHFGASDGLGSNPAWHLSMYVSAVQDWGNSFQSMFQCSFGGNITLVLVMNVLLKLFFFKQVKGQLPVWVMLELSGVFEKTD